MPGSGLPVTRSVLSAEALLATVAPQYVLGEPIRCTLLSVGQNDTYLLETTHGRSILRVYHAHRRTVSDISYELALLDHLAGRDVAVATAVVGKEGRQIQELAAPEGSRQVALFTYAPGKPAGEEPHGPYLLGKSLATLHTAADDFRSPHQRFQRDLRYLLDQPLLVMQPLLADRQDEWTYLMQLAERLRTIILQLASLGLDWGVCHGDATLANVHIADDRSITWFDFDNCAPGWRASDLAVARWEAQMRRDEAQWDSFLGGYLEQRPLSEVDRRAIPVFVAAGVIQLMGGLAEKVAEWGIASVHRSLDFFIPWLRDWEAQLPPDTA